MKAGKSLKGVPYWLGGLLLGILNIAVFYVSGKPWGITSALVRWGGGPLPAAEGAEQVFYRTVLIMGVIMGAMAAALLFREFRIRWPRKTRQYGAAVLGGFLMGYGARLSDGCSIGALVGGIASGSLHGWIFGLFLLPGIILGLIIARRFFYE